MRGTREFGLMSTTCRVWLLLLVLLAVAPPSAAQAKFPAVGYLGAATSASSGPAVDALRGGLRELGWVEGRNLEIEFRFAEGRADRLPALATELVQRKVDLIVALPSSATIAAHAATKTIPIVAVSIADPVQLGLAASLARPGANVTGLTFSVGLDIWAKQLQLLQEAVPSLRRVAILANPGNPGHALGVESLQRAAQAIGLAIQFVEAGSPEALDGAFAGMARERAEAVVVLGDPLFSSHADRVTALSMKLRLATMHTTRANFEAGGLMMYSPDLADQLRQAARYVDRILKGARPGDLPFEQPTKFELAVNLKTARALGLSIPPKLLLRADRVVE
jgi:putative ABC transport system substrate-binding protein